MKISQAISNPTKSIHLCAKEAALKRETRYASKVHQMTQTALHGKLIAKTWQGLASISLYLDPTFLCSILPSCYSIWMKALCHSIQFFNLLLAHEHPYRPLGVGRERNLTFWHRTNNTSSESFLRISAPPIFFWIP